MRHHSESEKYINIHILFLMVQLEIDVTEFSIFTTWVELHLITFLSLSVHQSRLNLSLN